MTAYDRWLTTQPEEPETCPMCGNDNWNEDGEPLAPEHFPFCSTTCATTAAKREAEWERIAYTCPTCGHHLDDHTVTIANDPEFGDYETYVCPATVNRDQDDQDRINALFDL